jgi:hypothetical protein
LHKHAESLFSGTFLPSHDHTHHRRVWNICKNLLRSIVATCPDMDHSLVEGVLIAAYFHDLGTVRSAREDHGILGKEICETYFKENAIEPPSRFDEILNAIEQHDIKEKKVYSGIVPGVSPGILDILSLADDLEALGVIGIYRYTEIYLKRNIKLKDLGIRILGNASARYRNITESCVECPSLIREYRKQYTDLVSFFDNYNQQILTNPQTENVFYGHLGVVNYIRRLSVEGQTAPSDFLSEINISKTGSVVTGYFTALKNELVKARL